MPQWTILITEPIHPDGARLLEARGARVLHLPAEGRQEAFHKIVSEIDGCITRGNVKVSREAMVSSSRLKVIGVHGIGCDHIDLTAAKELGRAVVNTPDALTVTVAEMSLALTLALTRRVTAADQAVRTGGWNRKYSDLIGVELAGKTVGLIGMGRIGEATARRLKAFGVELLYWSRTRKPSIEKETGIQWMELPDLLRRSDIVSLHLPATDETHHLLGAPEIALMKEGAILVNTARGRIVDQKALTEALREGRLAGAALDVFETEPLLPDDPLTKLPNVVLAPHLAASSTEAMQRMATQAAEGVLAVLNGEKPANRVV